MARVCIAFALIVATLLGRAALAAEADDLYRARVFVTGQGEANRAAGFARALEDVLVKVAGDPRLIGDARIAALAPQAGTLVATFSYRDLMEGIPTHDEQGTRDRPYELTVGFDRTRIDAALRALGRAPWPAPRPSVGVMVAVSLGPMPYVLARDGARGRDLRASLEAAAWRRGVPIVLPTQASLDEMGAGGADPTRLEAIARAPARDALLIGRLAWSDAALGWTAEWRLLLPGATAQWRISGVTFDDAFRNAMGGVAQVLSGNGQPD